VTTWCNRYLRLAPGTPAWCDVRPIGRADQAVAFSKFSSSQSPVLQPVVQCASFEVFCTRTARRPACGGDLVLPSESGPAQIVIIEGNGQNGSAGSALRFAGGPGGRCQGRAISGLRVAFELAAGTTAGQVVPILSDRLTGASLPLNGCWAAAQEPRASGARWSARC
jgi:hypothetical protein